LTTSLLGNREAFLGHHVSLDTSLKYIGGKDKLTDDNLKEAVAQAEAIRAQYHNPDGTPRPGWLKAPNGKDSKLAEADPTGRVWCLVRTAAFKARHGDWEAVAILEGIPIKSVSAKDIPIIGKGPIETARNWIKNNPIGIVETVIGDVEVDEETINTSMEHTHYKNKALVVPAIKPILARGAFLGAREDLYGLPEQNFYFAAPVDIDGERKIVFVRVKQKEKGDKKFHVHEVFTEDEIKNAVPLEQEIAKRKAGASNVLPSAPAFRPDRKQSDLYRSIIKNAYDVNSISKRISKIIIDENGEPRIVGGKFLKSPPTQMSETPPRSALPRRSSKKDERSR
jgi:hypothetical protein